MNKFKTFKTITAIAGLTVIGGGAAFAGMHWDGIKKVAQGPVYSEKELEEEVKTGTTQGTEKGYNDGYTKGFEDGVAYEPPEPEIDTVVLPKYSTIDGCPEEIKNSTNILQYRLDNTHILICLQGDDATGVYVFDSETKEFKQLSLEKNSKLLFARNSKLIIKSDYHINIFDYSNSNSQTICDSSEYDIPARIVTVGENIILINRFGVRKINVDEMSQTELDCVTSESWYDYRVSSGDYLYYEKNNSLIRLNLIDNTLTTISTDFSSSFEEFYRTEKFVLFVYNNVGMKILTFDNSQLTDVSTAGDYGLEIIKSYEKFIFIKTSSSNFYILNIEDGSVKNCGRCLKASLTFENDNYLIFSDIGMGCVIFNKTTKESVNVSSYGQIFKVVEGNNGFLLMERKGSTAQRLLHFNFDSKETQVFYTNDYDTIKKIDEKTWQLTSSIDNSQVSIFDEESKTVIKFAMF